MKPPHRREAALRADESNPAIGGTKEPPSTASERPNMADVPSCPIKTDHGTSFKLLQSIDLKSKIAIFNNTL
jgi:hypothetical protein